MASTHGSSSAACLWATGTSWHRKSEMLGIHTKIPSSGCWLVTVLCRSMNSTHFPQLRTTRRNHLSSSILLWDRARACFLWDFCLSFYSWLFSHSCFVLFILYQYPLRTFLSLFFRFFLFLLDMHFLKFTVAESVYCKIEKCYEITNSNRFPPHDKQ